MAQHNSLQDVVRRKAMMSLDRIHDIWALRRFEGEFITRSMPSTHVSEFVFWAIYQEGSGEIVMASDPRTEGQRIYDARAQFAGWPAVDNDDGMQEEGGRYTISRPLSGEPGLHSILLFDERELHKGFDESLKRSIVLTAITLAMLGLLGFLILRYRVLTPLHRLHDAIVGFHFGDRSVKIDVTAHDEIGRIGHGLNELFRNQLAIQAESEQLAQIAQVTNNLVLRLDSEGIVMWANRSVERLVGKPLRSFVGTGLDQLLPLREGHAWPFMREVVESGQGRTYEVALDVGENEPRIFRADSQPVVVRENGLFNGAVIVATDVTPLRQAQARLEQSEIRYNELVNSIDEVFFQTDREGRFIYLNQAWESVSGFTVTETLGERIEEFFHAHDRGEFTLRRKRVEDFEAGRGLCELRLMRSDGLERVVEVQLRGQRSTGGAFVGLAGKMRDVTLEREATEQLRRSRQRLARVLDGSNDGFWDYNVETGEFLMSPGHNRMLGFEPNEVEPTLEGWKELVHPEDLSELLRRFQSAIRDRSLYSCEYRMRSKAGSYIWVLDRGRVVDERDQRPLIVAGSITNINERVEVEQRTRRALEREQQVNEMKSRIVSMISHEYRTPLSSIRLSATLLQRYAGRLTDEERAKHLGFIFEAVDQMTHLIEEVLYLGRAEAGYMELDPQPHVLRKVVNGLVDWFNYLYPRRELDLQLKGDVDRVLMIDLTLFKRIATNLLTNAVKYSAADSVVSFIVELKGPHLILQVIDEGIGIPQEDQKHLFETFHRASNVGTIPGTGLGLVIIRRVVEKLGGQIFFESEEGRGTTFSIQLPALEAVEPAEATLSTELSDSR